MAVETKRELISRAEYARRKGVAARTIGKYCQRKIIPLHDNLIDPEEADRELAKILIKPLGSGRVSAKGKNGGKGMDNGISNGESSNGERLTNSYVEARTREKQLRVEILELDLQLKRGEMVLTKDVEFVAFNAARAIRDRMLNIPDRISAIVAAESNEIKVRDIIIGQIENELSSITDTYNQSEGSENGNEPNTNS